MSRLRTAAYALSLALLAPLLTVAQTPAVAPQPLTIAGATTHVYKTVGGHELRLHVFSPVAPAAAGRSASIVFFFGGGWTQGTVTQFVPQAQHFARRGMVAILADYRVRLRHGTTALEAMADARSAIRWIRSNAARLGIDPATIVAAGGSAGGHIALSAGVFDTFDEAGEDKRISAKPDALVLFNPAVDTSRDVPAMAERFGTRGREASPAQHVTAGLPPMLIVHGKADATVPYTDVERFCAEANARGNRCQLVGYDGASHGFFNPGVADGKWHRETLLEADRFLTKLGYLSEPVRLAPS
jgi:acetyl esterase/lipase